VPDGNGGPAGGCSDMKRWYRRLPVSVFTIAMLDRAAWEDPPKPNDRLLTAGWNRSFDFLGQLDAEKPNTGTDDRR
jgi:hypothetical protein